MRTLEGAGRHKTISAGQSKIELQKMSKPAVSQSMKSSPAERKSAATQALQTIPTKTEKHQAKSGHLKHGSGSRIGADGPGPALAVI
mmetsp:Transcript_123964/g.309837  ORF Transcript_123964/g.309837 Transcript_123964/m.309837 type:complete len:87 (+) Transcript_123964:336-596(+)